MTGLAEYAQLEETCERLFAEKTRLLEALIDATNALESFDGISIKGTKLHWTRADRQALQRARKLIATYD